MSNASEELKKAIADAEKYLLTCDYVGKIEKAAVLHRLIQAVRNHATEQARQPRTCIAERVAAVQRLECPHVPTLDMLYTEQLDELDRLELVMALETEFRVEIPDDIAAAWTCGNDAATYINTILPP
jgi:acyl carrier protein